MAKNIPQAGEPSSTNSTPTSPNPVELARREGQAGERVQRTLQQNTPMPSPLRTASAPHRSGGQGGISNKEDVLVWPSNPSHGGARAEHRQPGRLPVTVKGKGPCVLPWVSPVEAMVLIVPPTTRSASVEPPLNR